MLLEGMASLNNANFDVRETQSGIICVTAVQRPRAINQSPQLRGDVRATGHRGTLVPKAMGM
jgi:hypothetical protein